MIKHCLKNILIYIFVMIFCFNNVVFSAVISDNDGSAFVTKSEFEALKKSFNEQIEKYNTSIDSKIDGVIANYLAGINLNDADITDYWERIVEISSNNFWISNYVSSSYASIVNAGLSTYSSGQNVVTKRELYYKYWSNPVHEFASLVRNTLADNFVFTTLGNPSYCKADKTYPNDHLAFGQRSKSNSAAAAGNDVWITNLENTTWDRTSATNVLNSNTSGFATFTNTVMSRSDGNGAGFVFHTSGAGYKFLRDCCEQLYAIPSINIFGHSYKDFYSTNSATLYNIYCVDTGRDDNTSLSIDLGDFADSSSEISAGTALDSTSTTNGAWANGYIDINKVTDGVDYNFIQWGKAPSTKFVTIEDTYPMTQNTAQTEITADSNKTTRQSITYFPTGPSTYNSNVSGVSAKYRGVSLKFNDNQNWTDYTQEILSNISGQDVRIAGGIPIARITSSQGEVDLKIKIKFKSNSGNSRNIKMTISNGQFNNGEIASDKKSIIGGWKDLTTGTDYEYTLNLEGKDNTIWLNMYIDGTVSDLITIDTLQMSVI